MGPGTVAKIRAMKLARVASTRDRRILPLMAYSLFATPQAISSSHVV
jgi:hypothetical protein